MVQQKPDERDVPQVDAVGDDSDPDDRRGTEEPPEERILRAQHHWQQNEKCSNSHEEEPFLQLQAGFAPVIWGNSVE